jgi:hypothetical protein
MKATHLVCYMPLFLLLLPYNGPVKLVTNYTNLTKWSWALLEKPPVVQLLMNFAAFYGNPSWEAISYAATQELPNILWNPKVHLPCSREPSAGPYAEPDQSSPYHPIMTQ